jgi:hypothetical protein
MEILSLKTGSGFFSPLILIIGFIAIMAIVYLIRGFGEKGYKKGTEQTKPFLSGGSVASPADTRVGADNIYWGFVEGLKGYYKILQNLHSGIVNDYVAWFVVILAIVFVVILIT